MNATPAAPENTSGHIEKIVFHNQENSFYILSIKPKQGPNFYVKGSFAIINVGAFAIFYGSWEKHIKFGMQFSATSIEQEMPKNAKGIENYLASGAIKGIGKGFAKRLVDYLGADTLEILDKHPDKLLDVPGIGHSRVELIKKCWQENKAVRQIMIFLHGIDISASLAAKIFKLYGYAALEKIQQDPYRLAFDIWGVGFKKADIIAGRLNIAPDAPRRIQAGIIHALRQNAESGSLYQARSDLIAKTSELLQLENYSPELIPQAIQSLINEYKITEINNQDQNFIGLSSCVHAEKQLAQTVLELLKHPCTKTLDLPTIFQTLNNSANQTLSQDQIKGVMCALSSKISIITGGPGTGKTTLLANLLKILQHQKITIKLCAPTGRAAKRAQTSSGYRAETLHRMLAYNPAIGKFEKNAQDTLQADFIIVDEFSMVDTFLALALFRAVAHGSQVLILGDVDQLPSVGPGSVFADLINSKKIPCIKLTEIFRQAQDSLIIKNAHAVNQGSFPALSSNSAHKKDFVFIRLDDTDQLDAVITKIYTTYLPQAHIAPDQAMTLTPMHKGQAGSSKLNTTIKNLLNPQTSESPRVITQGQEFCMHDSVMQIRNNYDKGIFNGDVGKITKIDAANRCIMVNFDNKEVTYENFELSELVLAYAISIHKSQGSEFDAVIVPIFAQHFMMLKRNILYTAITRAKKMCFLVGQVKAIAMAVKNIETNKRITMLPRWLDHA